MYIRIFQKGFNYSQDGIGNRLVYHLQGCNMKCPWCANPEGIPLDGALMVDEDWLFDTLCPHGAVKEKKVDRTVCAGCQGKECMTQHASKGIRCSFVEYGTTAVLQEIQRSQSLFFDHGGVTFTGGEPTLQFDSLKTLLQEIHGQGIHTAIESNASHPRLEELFPHTDQLIMDFKHYDSEKHRAYTGIPNTVVKRNIAKAFASHPCVHIRIPLVGGFNSTREDAERFAGFFSRLDTRRASFELLAYHEFGKVKWGQCGFDYRMEDAFIPPQAIHTFETVFAEQGLSCVRT